jgi:hypothetical protein
MQLTRNSLPTAAGPSDWFTGSSRPERITGTEPRPTGG